MADFLLDDVEPVSDSETVVHKIVLGQCITNQTGASLEIPAGYGVEGAGEGGLRLPSGCGFAQLRFQIFGVEPERSGRGLESHAAVGSDQISRSGRPV
jgi:hypothetical protein